jgi:DNA repair protein RadA/Sms
LLCVGELGLTGEVRPVVALEQRLKEASKLGFRKAIVPSGNLPLETNIENMQIIGVEYLIDALAIAMPGADLKASGERSQEKQPEVEAGGSAIRM